jgi:hypothetical protein
VDQAAAARISYNRRLLERYRADLDALAKAARR